jgi:hypothetical protein
MRIWTCTAVVASLMLTLAPAPCGIAGRASASAGHANPVANPTVRGPFKGGLHNRPWFSSTFSPASYGYVEQEFFYSGVAVARGTHRPARYATRMLVYRPADPRRFSGNVVVEWNNVTLQFDLPVEFTWARRQVMAAGDAYVQLTVQQAGVCGLGLSGAGALGVSACEPLSLKGFDPVRYASLVHPGDAYADDIFSQGAQAVLHPKGTPPLGGLRARRLFAVGESQSAAGLDDYIRLGADGQAQLFAGFLIDADAHTTLPATYRVPTIHLWSEESAQPVRTTSGRNHVIWSVVGAAHVDYSMIRQTMAGLTESLRGTHRWTRQRQDAFDTAVGNYGQQGPDPTMTCAGGSAFPRRYAVDAALSDLETWARTGTPAPSAPPFEFTGVGRLIQRAPTAPALTVLPTVDVNLLGLVAAPMALNRSTNGVAVGGLRLPIVRVPAAAYNGSACVLLGTSVPLPPSQLHRLYPTHPDYVARLLAATRAAVRGRFLTVRDGVDLLERACASAIPRWGRTPVGEQPAVCSRLAAVLRRAATAR